MLFVPRSVWSSSWVPSHVDWPALFSFCHHLFRLTLAPTHRPPTCFTRALPLPLALWIDLFSVLFFVCFPLSQLLVAGVASVRRTVWFVRVSPPQWQRGLFSFCSEVVVRFCGPALICIEYTVLYCLFPLCGSPLATYAGVGI